jgi:DNA modification methylase
MIINGSADRIPLEAGSVHCVVTSPPYWALRSYSGEQQREWAEVRYSPMAGLPEIIIPAWVGALGLEPTPEMHVGHIVAVFREVWRVLRDDGVAWINYGSNYSSGGRPPNRSLYFPSASSYGIDDITPEDCRGFDCAYFGLCDEHRADYHRHLLRTIRNDQPCEPISPQLWKIIRDSVHGGLSSVSLDAWHLYVLASTTLESYQQLRGECSRCANGEAALLGRHSFFGGVPGFARKKVYPSVLRSISSDIQTCPDTSESTGGTSDFGGALVCRILDKAFDFCSWIYSTTTYHHVPAGNDFGTPWRVAFALQADGWILRGDVIWAKPSPMPESLAGWRWERERVEVGRDVMGGKQPTNKGSFVTDYRNGRGYVDGGKDRVTWEYGEGYELRRGSWRHTRAHEFVFMATKRMGYWSDQDAVREAAVVGSNGSSFTSDYDVQTKPGLGMGPREEKAGRNPRSVLDVPSQPYKGSHYATYPPALIAPLILATCPRRACPVCGQGWSPVVERGLALADDGETCLKCNKKHGKAKIGANESGAHLPEVFVCRDDRTTGQRPTCDCGRDDYVPGIVFDPFLGSGTSGEVAQELQRRWVGLDISRDYLVDQAKLRTNFGSQDKPLDDLPMFANLKKE